MIRLFHMGESTCAQRVRLVLAEKELEWESILVPPAELRAPAYLARNPAGVVPTLQHEGATLVESRIICEYLEDAFPAPALMPFLPVDRHRVRRWTKAYDDQLHLAIFVLTFLVRMRARYAAMPKKHRELALPGLTDPVKRRVSQELLKSGWASPIAAVALRHFLAVIARLDDALGQSRWLCGERFTLADIDMLVIAQRLDDIGLAALWDEHAALAGWLERARSRAPFDAAIAGWRDADTMRANRASADAAAEEFARLLAAL